MRVLLTGHQGYIGSHVFDPEKMFGVDLKDGRNFADLIWQDYDAVIHLAASVSVTESFERPVEYFNNNALQLTRFLARNSVGRFIFASTGGAMYGNRRLAKEEDAKWELCQSPYAQSKFLAEEIIRQHTDDHVILRLANVYGGNVKVRGEANVHKHFGEDTPITVYGGKQTRDFVHIDVVCQAIRRALANPSIRGTFNIGSGVETSIRGLAEGFSQERGVSLVTQPARAGEVEHVSLDPSKAFAARLL